MSAVTIVHNFKDYVPRWFRVHSLTLTSLGGIPRGAVEGDSAVGEKPAYGTLMDIVFQCFGNYVGIPMSTAGGVYDVVKSGVIEMLGGASTQKFTYYPSHCDEAIIYDSQIVENNEGPSANPYIFQITLLHNVPFRQAEDILMDVNLTRWGYHRVLTHMEKMITDPIYCAEENAHVERLPSRLSSTTLDPRPRKSHLSTPTGDVEQ